MYIMCVCTYIYIYIYTYIHIHTYMFRHIRMPFRVPRSGSCNSGVNKRRRPNPSLPRPQSTQSTAVLPSTRSKLSRAAWDQLTELTL